MLNACKNKTRRPFSITRDSPEWKKFKLRSPLSKPAAQRRSTSPTTANIIGTGFGTTNPFLPHTHTPPTYPPLQLPPTPPFVHHRNKTFLIQVPATPLYKNPHQAQPLAIVLHLNCLYQATIHHPHNQIQPEAHAGHPKTVHHLSPLLTVNHHKSKPPPSTEHHHHIPLTLRAHGHHPKPTNNRLPSQPPLFLPTSPAKHL